MLMGLYSMSGERGTADKVAPSDTAELGLAYGAYIQLEAEQKRLAAAAGHFSAINYPCGKSRNQRLRGCFLLAINFAVIPSKPVWATYSCLLGLQTPTLYSTKKCHTQSM